MIQAEKSATFRNLALAIVDPRIAFEVAAITIVIVPHTFVAMMVESRWIGGPAAWAGQMAVGVGDWATTAANVEAGPDPIAVHILAHCK